MLLSFACQSYVVSIPSCCTTTVCFSNDFAVPLCLVDVQIFSSQESFYLTFYQYLIPGTFCLSGTFKIFCLCLYISPSPEVIADHRYQGMDIFLQNTTRISLETNPTWFPSVEILQNSHLHMVEKDGLKIFLYSVALFPPMTFFCSFVLSFCFCLNFLWVWNCLILSSVFTIFH